MSDALWVFATFVIVSGTWFLISYIDKMSKRVLYTTIVSLLMFLLLMLILISGA